MLARYPPHCQAPGPDEARETESPGEEEEVWGLPFCDAVTLPAEDDGVSPAALPHQQVRELGNSPREQGSPSGEERGGGAGGGVSSELTAGASAAEEGGDDLCPVEVAQDVPPSVHQAHQHVRQHQPPDLVGVGPHGHQDPVEVNCPQCIESKQEPRRAGSLNRRVVTDGLAVARGRDEGDRLGGGDGGGGGGGGVPQVPEGEAGDAGDDVVAPAVLDLAVDVKLHARALRLELQVQLLVRPSRARAGEAHRVEPVTEQRSYGRLEDFVEDGVVEHSQLLPRGDGSSRKEAPHVDLRDCDTLPFQREHLLGPARRTSTYSSGELARVVGSGDDEAHAGVVEEVPELEDHLAPPDAVGDGQLLPHEDLVDDKGVNPLAHRVQHLHAHPRAEDRCAACGNEAHLVDSSAPRPSIPELRRPRPLV
eukprot:757096-Hanusia_phi.AAC.5